MRNDLQALTIFKSRQTLTVMFGQLSLFSPHKKTKKKQGSKKALSSSSSSSSSKEFLRVGAWSVQVQRRRYQRSLNLLIHANGQIKVTAGRSVAARDIEKFVLKQYDWIEKNLAQFEEVRKRYPKKKYIDDEEFLFSGEKLRLKILETSRRRGFVERQNDNLILHLPERSSGRSLQTSAQSAAKLIRDFYKKQGQKILDELVEKNAERMQLFPKNISYRSMRSRWGSCSSQGRISLNWRLVVFSEEVMEYVVIHELAHLRYQNHSQAFWRLVDEYCPSFQQHKKTLKEHHLEVDFLSQEKQSEL